MDAVMIYIQYIRYVFHLVFFPAVASSLLRLKDTETSPPIFLSFAPFHSVPCLFCVISPSSHDLVLFVVAHIFSSWFFLFKKKTYLQLGHKNPAKKRKILKFKVDGIFFLREENFGLDIIQDKFTYFLCFLVLDQI
jgi:hypothetical protein